ncbi:MAG: sigma-70 family RNA polymerase sigma factor, partial [Actinobacteria bacterium]|nr:sigma-70 family RNA polymerase sigma factor [Actinomycetota bacterium]
FFFFASNPGTGAKPNTSHMGLRFIVMERGPDVKLAERLMARDESALRVVVDRYAGVVHGVALRIIGEKTMAEEVAQDTFLAVWRRPGAYDPQRGSLQSFLLGITRNKAIDLVRREESLRRTKEALMAETPLEIESPPGFGFEERQEVQDALAQLSDLQREAVVLAYFGGRTYREVATELQIPEGTAKTRLRDGLTRLRSLMDHPKEARE